MSFEINLLTKQQIFSPQLIGISKTVKKFAYICVGLFILLVLLVIGVSLFFNKKVTDIDKKISLAKQQIGQAKSTESVYMVYYQKLSSLDSVIKNRFYPDLLFTSIQSTIPAEAVLSGIVINPESLLLTIDMSSLEVLHQVIDRLQNSLDLPIKEINLQGIDKIKGRYQVKFLLPLVTAKKETKSI